MCIYVLKNKNIPMHSHTGHFTPACVLPFSSLTSASSLYQSPNPFKMFQRRERRKKEVVVEGDGRSARVCKRFSASIHVGAV